ncbi:ComF family protein [Leucobacter chromiireducens]|uniref:ComF family protein n=1 Tax=Leucobacter chromiireducens TaxID=283877 RepID=UPI000F638672|nr:phosphoribosyltransferase family protein [Leucobacter chromiireducens]
MTWYAPLREVALDVLALVLPTACRSCGAPDREFCDRCVAAVRAPAEPLRLDLGVPVAARGPYAGPLRALLLAFKHGGRVRSARLLGAQLRVPLAAVLAAAPVGRLALLVPVPSTPARFRARGYRPVELLGASALRGQRFPVRLTRALRTTRGRRGQVGLAPRERARNARLLAVRRVARPRIRGRDVVLLDDVLTTGATVLAARDACESAGARVVAIVVLCVAESRAESGAEQALGADES